MGNRNSSAMVFQIARSFTKLAFADGHDVDGVLVPTEGFNVFGALAPSACAGDAAPGNIYCLGDYKATGDGLDAALDANAKASYVGREWSNLAPFDAAAPGGAS